MANLEKTISNLKNHGFDACSFKTSQEAVDYVASQLSGETIGFGGSKTVEGIGLFERLAENNTVYWHWKQEAGPARKNAAAADVYICSANGVSETGEIVNIDGAGNRISATLFGKKKVFIIIGTNKIMEDYDKAVWRARNIASPLNVRRLGAKTPCATGELKCHDCSSPERLCKGLVVLWRNMAMQKTEVIIIEEELGY